MKIQAKIILLLFVIAVLPMSLAADSDTGVVDAIMYLMDREPGHPKKGNTEWATEIAEAIAKSSAADNHDPFLLVSIGNWESRFRPDILRGKTKGKAGEVGIFQCGKDCKRNCPYFMDTIEGQAMCGSRWLAQAHDACKAGEKEALTYYASGAVCDADKYTPNCETTEAGVDCVEKERNKLKAKVRRRVKLAERLRNRFGQ